MLKRIVFSHCKESFEHIYDVISAILVFTFVESVFKKIPNCVYHICEHPEENKKSQAHTWDFLYRYGIIFIL